MPIYEYRCPNGHTFEVFQRMSDPAVTACEVCGSSPVEKLLFPVAVQLKAFGSFALAEISVFIVLLFVAFVYVWRRGALEWK